MSDQNDPARCNIVCGSGETEVISMIIRAFAAPGEAILMHNPCFPIYRIYSACEGRTSILAPMGQDFDPMLDDYIQLLGKKPRVAFVTNPHNPSGVFLEEDQVRRICDAASKETLVVLDEAYIHYSERTA
jgi:histidinol-phosphate aminotransferase